MGLATDPAYAAYYHGYSNGLATELDWTTTLWCTYDCPFTEHLNVLHPMKSIYGWDTVLETCEPSICLQYHIEKFQHSVYVQSACHVFFSTHCIWIGISVCALGSPMPGCGWAPMQQFTPRCRYWWKGLLVSRWKLYDGWCHLLQSVARATLLIYSCR